MAKGKNVPDMKLTSVLKKWMEQEEWTGEIEISDDRLAAQANTSCGINNQSHRLLVEIDEQAESAKYPQGLPDLRFALS